MSENLLLKEAAAHLRMHPVTLTRLMGTKNHPPGRKVGGRWKFNKQALDSYLAGEKWQEAPTPSLPEVKKAPSTSVTPTPAVSAYLEALGLPTATLPSSGRRSSTRKRIE